MGPGNWQRRLGGPSGAVGSVAPPVSARVQRPWPPIAAISGVPGPDQLARGRRDRFGEPTMPQGSRDGRNASRSVSSLAGSDTGGMCHGADAGVLTLMASTADGPGFSNCALLPVLADLPVG